MRELKQGLADKAEAEKQANEDVARLQKEVKIFKLMKYRDKYNNGVQGKPPRYLSRLGAYTPIKRRWESWPPMLFQ